MPRVISFLDYDGRTRHISTDRIVDLRESNGRANDNGDVRVEAGASTIQIAFYSETEATKVLDAWRAAQEEK